MDKPDKPPMHEDFLKKEEEKERWVKYWVVLRSSVLYFYDDQTDLWHEYCDKIEITPNAKCSAVRRKTYSHRFKLITDEGTWLLKCHTNLQRHRWMHAIELVVQEISSEPTKLAPVVATPPRGRYEQELFGRSIRREMLPFEAAAVVARESNNNTLDELSLNFQMDDKGSKRETRASRNSSKVKKSTYKDKHTTIAFKALQCEGVSNPDLGSPLENLAFSDDEVDVDGKAKQHNFHAPVAKLICVESASKRSISAED